MKTHSKTGHEHATLKPWDERNCWTRPEELDVSIRKGMECDTEPDEQRTCDRGTEHCWVDHASEEPTWYAYIKGRNPGEPDWLTHGYSAVQALDMAHDLVRTLYEECKAGETHCYCQDVTWAWPDEDKVTHAKKCCVCGDESPVSEFQDE